MKKRVISICLAMIMMSINTVLPIQAVATEESVVNINDDIDFDEDGLLSEENQNIDIDKNISLNENIDDTIIEAQNDTIYENTILTEDELRQEQEYEAKLRAEMAEAQGGDMSLAAVEFPSYEQYLADWAYDNGNNTMYQLYKNEFEMPYRSYVETRRDDPTWQTLLAAWRVATFSLSDITSYSEKEVSFYETILFDMLYQGPELTSLSGGFKKGLNTLQSSSIKKMSEMQYNNTRSFIKQNIADMSKDELDTLRDTMINCDEFKNVFSFIGDVSTIFGYADTVENLIYQVAKAEVILANNNETAKILITMKDATSNINMKTALQNMIWICSENGNAAGVAALLELKEGVEFGFNKLLEKGWSYVLEHLGAAGIGIPVGQSAGKMLTGYMFSTEADVEMYYELCALYEFEDVLKSALSTYESYYKSSKTDQNASIFMEAYKMLLQTHLLGVKSSQQYVDSLYKNGAINELLFYFREDEYDEYTKKLGYFKNDVESALEFLETDVYNAYADEYNYVTGDDLDLDKEEVKFPPAQQEVILKNIKSDSFELGNIIITDDMTLTDDIHTYGSVYLRGGVLDINGHKLEVDGDFIIASSITVNQDESRKYNPTNGKLKMANATDLVIVKGDFITNGGITNMTAGTIEIGGNFKQYGSNYSSSASGNRNSFYSCGSHKVIFNGTGIQDIYFESPNYSKFNIVEFQNGKISTSSAIHGFTLAADAVFENDITLSVGGLDFNGHAITAKKNLYHSGGEFNINKGKLCVYGNYIAAHVRENENGETTYGETVSKLSMVNATDSVIVKGDFITNGGITNMTAGTIEIGGNFKQYGSNPDQASGNRNSFYSCGSHKVIFNGAGIQDIYFESPNYSRFAKLQIENKTGPIVFSTNTTVSSTLTQPGGADIQGREKVTLQNKSAFEDHGAENAAINRYVGNAVNVIPTWMDYEAYINHTGPIETPTPSTPPTSEPEIDSKYIINDIAISNGAVNINITKESGADSKLIVAAYSDGALVNVLTNDISLADGATDDVSVNLNTDGATYIVAFIWDNLSDMIPVSNKVTKTL